MTDVVLEVLKQCKKKAEALNLNKTDLFLDHAIYTKAVEIVMNEKFTDLKLSSTFGWVDFTQLQFS